MKRKIKIFHCKNKYCNLAVGETDGEFVSIFGKTVPFEPLYFAFDCPHCGRKIIWERAGYRENLQTKAKI